MKTLLPCVVLATLCGCARFSTTQTDIRSNAETKETTTVITRAASWTFFDSKSALAKWKATQSDNRQSAEVGGLSQQADGTNVVGLIEAVSKGATRGAMEFLKPVP